MARYRVLEIIAPNAAHSVLAGSWWVDGAYFYQHRYDSLPWCPADATAVARLKNAANPRRRGA